MGSNRLGNTDHIPPNQSNIEMDIALFDLTNSQNTAGGTSFAAPRKLADLI